MSLHSLAQHLQSAGRGEDKVLVHMTPGEVSGLQSLAMAHGGSLTINPQTGLPEASFLRRMLPMIAGFALGPAGLGLTAMQAGLAVGAVGTAATGSLGRGLMMGLGAYGGAGLGAGLSSMGTTTPTAAVPNMNVATTGVEGMKANLYGPGQGVFSQGIPPTAATTTGAGAGAITPTGGMSGLSAYTAPKPIYDMGAGLQQQLTPMGQLSHQMAAAPANPITPMGQLSHQMAAAPANPPVTPVFDIGKNLQFNPPSTAVASTSTPTANLVSRMPTEATVDTVATVPQTQFDKIGAGFKQATSGVQGLKDLYAATEAAAPYGLYAGLGSYALGSYYDKLDNAKQPPKTHPGMIRPYTYERSQNPEAYDIGTPIYSDTPGSSAEQNYFTDRYTALTPYEAPGPEYKTAAKGGLMGLAVGGPVEQMAAMNAVGANTGYPMAGINTPMYANPIMQRPEAVNVLSPSSDAGVGAYSGEPRFAFGGPTTKTATARTTGEYKYSYDPNTMQFTQTSAPKVQQNPLGNFIGKLMGVGPAPDTGPKVSGGMVTMSGPFGNVPMPVGMLTPDQRLRALEQNQSAAPTPAPTPAASVVSGGMASPAVQPSAPAYAGPSIPEYKSATQHLGLEGFYPMMERRLAALGAAQGYAGGGDVYSLGGYSDGGRLLKGPGDGVSDSIPAVIGQRQPARLADGEFVIPARIVSEIGNGSTEAGARKLYAMMDRVQNARRKTVGKKKVAVNTRSEKYLPA